MTFIDGQSLSTITLTIAGDVQPELSETTIVSLTQVLANGVPEGGDLNRGATILPGREQAVVTVQASDAPHGVVSWLPAIVTVTEEEGVDSVVMLSLVREFGSIGAIIIEYSTSVASFFPSEQQAAALVDFVPSSGEVVMGDGVREASVDVTILHVSTHVHTLTPTHTHTRTHTIFSCLLTYRHKSSLFTPPPHTHTHTHRTILLS